MSLASPVDYYVSGNTLTITAGYLEGLNLSAGDTAEFEISFNVGDSAALAVEAVKNYKPGSDATLSDLTVGGSTVSGFTPGTYTCSVKLPHGTLPGSAAATVGATPSDPKATINVIQAASLPGSATVLVAAEDKATIQTYTVNFTFETVSNKAPKRKAGVPATTSASVTVNAAYTLDLLTIFEDTDSDPLAYTVSVDGASPVAAAVSFAYIPVSAGDIILVFKANDGTADSDDTYTVTLTASAAPPKTYALTITARTGGSTTTGSSSYAAGTVINIAATPSSGYSFNKWTSDGGGTFGSATSAGTTFTMPANDVTITASFTYNGSGGGSGSHTSAPSYKADVSGSGTSGTPLPVNVNTNNGSASVDLRTPTGDIFTDGGTMLITVPSIPGVDTYALGISASFLTGSQGEGSLTLTTGMGSITIPDNMLSGIPGTEGKKAGITIGQGDKSGLPDEVKTSIGNRPLVQLTLTLDGTQTDWNNPSAPVTVSIPYTPTTAELADPEHIVVWYIDGAGNAVSVPNGRYDPATGAVNFTTTHFSYYAIAYVQKTFGDLGSVAWAKGSIEVLASKGILEGTSETEYSPQTNITRADFLCFLVRTLGVDAEVDGNFDDINSDNYYYKEIGIAKAFGITKGTGNNKFSPDAYITRQDMMVLSERVLRMLKKLEAQGSASDLGSFTDKSLVAAYAVNSVASVVKEGLIVGSGNKVNPLGNTTRAEAAAFLYRVYNKYAGY